MAINRHLYKRNCVCLVPVFCAFFTGVLLTLLLVDTGLECQTADNGLMLPENTYFLVVLIISAPGNIEQRNAIRETWLNLRPKIINSSYQNEVIHIPDYNAHGILYLEPTEMQDLLLRNYENWTKRESKNIKVSNFKIKHLFSIGTEGLDKKTRTIVQEEQEVYSDILELNLSDSYQNLTTKILKSLNKIHQKYDFKYLMKVDDDTYLKLDLLAEDLLSYHDKLVGTSPQKNLELYWGYFNGRANIKQKGVWRETNFHLCDRYLPYALGGGYVLSKNLVTYITTNGDNLYTFVSEDISVGSWLSPFKNIHKRHDVRFDTAYMARKCRNYHIVLHKRSPQHMRDLYKGKLCTHEGTAESEKKLRRPHEYFYDWTKSPTKCCDVLVS